MGRLFWLRIACAAAVFFGVGAMAYEYFVRDIASMAPIYIGAALALAGFAGNAACACAAWARSARGSAGPDTGKRRG